MAIWSAGFDRQMATTFGGNPEGVMRHRLE
jgi:hypothetical protein